MTHSEETAKWLSYQQQQQKYSTSFMRRSSSPRPNSSPFYIQFLTIKKPLWSTFYWQKKPPLHTPLHTKFRTLNPFCWTAVNALCYIHEQKDRIYGGKVYILVEGLVVISWTQRIDNSVSTRTSLVNNGVVVWPKRELFWPGGTKRGKFRTVNLTRSGSQLEHRIRIRFNIHSYNKPFH